MSDSACTGDSCPVDFSSRTKDTSSASSASCPVDHSSMSSSNVSASAMSLENNSESDSSNNGIINKPASVSPPTCPVDHTDKRIINIYMQQQEASGVNPDNQMPAVPEQRRSDNQTHALSTSRTVSSIPRADRYQAAGQSECPAVDQPSTAGGRDMWIYPSEQMFFNAMRRKNWDPKERDMQTVVPIHNAVNEKCWSQIMEWEQMHRTQCQVPMLLRFEGKAKEVTPKARVRSLFGYQMPFDRHDWTVDRCGKPVRYVIDFYQGKADPKNPNAPSFYLDVRPALTVEGAWDRTRRFFTSLF
ncbi:Cytochrome c1 heme lyase [Coemansia sp. RSA 485]|nr:Cytochrome c1 heme lyase [Coemansia sp. RSA 485]